MRVALKRCVGRATRQEAVEFADDGYGSGVAGVVNPIGQAYCDPLAR